MKIKPIWIIAFLMIAFLIWAYDSNTQNLWLFTSSNGTDSVGGCQLTPIDTVIFSSPISPGDTKSAGPVSASAARLYSNSVGISSGNVCLQYYFEWLDSTQTNRYPLCDSAQSLYVWANSGQLTFYCNPGGIAVHMPPVNVAQSTIYILQEWLGGGYLHSVVYNSQETPIATASVTCGITTMTSGANMSILNFYAGTVPFNGYIGAVRLSKATPNGVIHDTVPTFTFTVTSTFTNTTTPTFTNTTTPTFTQTATPTATQTVTKTVTQTVTPTITPTATPTNTPYATPIPRPGISPLRIIGFSILVPGERPLLIFKFQDVIVFDNWYYIFDKYGSGVYNGTQITPLYVY